MDAFVGWMLGWGERSGEFDGMMICRVEARLGRNESAAVQDVGKC